MDYKRVLYFVLIAILASASSSEYIANKRELQRIYYYSYYYYSPSYYSYAVYYYGYYYGYYTYYYTYYYSRTPISTGIVVAIVVPIVFVLLITGCLVGYFCCTRVVIRDGKRVRECKCRSLPPPQEQVVI